jgi:O-antigen/teichoic acid export membrane protein
VTDAIARVARLVLGSPLVRRAGVYTLSSVVSKAIPFLLLPVLTRYLTPADYGIVAMFLMATTVLQPGVSLSLNAAVSVLYFDRREDLPRYIGSGAVVILGLTVVSGLVVLALGGPLATLTAVPGGWLGLAVILVAARGMASVALTLLQVQERALAYAVYQNLQSAAILSFSVVLVVGFDGHWRSRISAEVAAVALSALVATFWLHRTGWLRGGFVKEHARHLVRFGLPFIPHALGSVAMVQTDRLFLTHMVGVDETGLYAVGALLAMPIEMLAASFNTAYTPWLFKKLAGGDDDTKRRLVVFTYAQFVLIALLALAVAIILPWFAVTFLGDKFAGSAAYVRWFAVMYAFSGMYYMVTNYTFYAQRTAALSTVTVIAAVVNVPLNVIFISAHGGVGAAEATACAMAIRFLLTWVVSARVYPMPWGHPFRRRGGP